jgi:membrane protease YdiL (CAAX protease family)
MNEVDYNKEDEKIYLNPKFQLFTIYIWFFLGAIIVIFIFIIISGFNISIAMSTIQNNPQLYIFIEFSSVGLLPIIYVLVSKEKISKYGVNAENLVKSISISFLMILIYFLLGYLINGKIMTYEEYDFNLKLPWNLFFGIGGIFVWGPLEAYFFIWLIEKTNDAFFSDEKKIIVSALFTSLMFGVVLHLITTSLYNAIYTGIIFLILSLIYVYTKNSIGPILAWTLLNGQVWFIGQMILA